MSKTNINEIEVNGVVYVPKVEKLKMNHNTDGLPFVCIRTYSAGVHCGYLKSKEGREVVLLDSIRIYYWSGAASLSQLATEGVKNPSSCKFAVPVPEITLTEVIEVIPMTEEAVANIRAVPTWKK